MREIIFSEYGKNLHIENTEISRFGAIFMDSITLGAV
jgi:hypothetical protein